MSYFQNNAHLLRLKPSTRPGDGLRPGQIGALHALAAHFIEREDPAIISLPTGYGKTSVITACGFLLSAKKVLVITSTTLLRQQAFNEFSELRALRRLGCLPSDVQNPRSSEIKKRIVSTETWASFDQTDVVVCTPHTITSPEDEYRSLPDGMFDVIVFDEGHHSPAKTWSSLIAATPSSKHVLLTATPFRTDKRQLPGKLAFYYPLRRAVEEAAFGKVEFVPATTDEVSSGSRDIVLAEKALEIFRRDTSNGLSHKILARTSRISEAESISAIYSSLGLRVEPASSKLSAAQITAIESRLHDDEIDGIVCVDMFGEGYDFPRFKIAVLHSAHKSLVPTLQFIGRFARTNDARTGNASFVALPADVNSESSQLYKAGVDWDSLLSDVAEARRTIFIEERKVLQSFSPNGHPSADYEAISADSIRMSQHIAAYRLLQDPVLDESPSTIDALEVTNSWISDDHRTHILIARSIQTPAWYVDDEIFDSSHQCFVVRYFPDSNTMYISSTYRSERCYSDLLDFFCSGHARPLSFDRTRRVLNGMTDQEFYSVGIRSTSPSTTAESYRIVAGSSADRGVRESDATSFTQGHFMGRGKVNGSQEVIGASAGGRIWSNRKLSIPQLLDWMNLLHTRINASELAVGRSGLDILPYGESLELIPESTCMADWAREAYRDNPSVLITTDSGTYSTSILDLEISGISVGREGSHLTFSIGDAQAQHRYRYDLNRSPNYSALSRGAQVTVTVSDSRSVSLEDWLQDNSLTFFTKDLDSFSRGTFQRRVKNNHIREESLAPRDWSDCEIGIEFDLSNSQRRTVQRFMQDIILSDTENNFVVFDHRSGEAADFIVGRISQQARLIVSLYHCKAAGGAASGERVDDVYEIACQAVKSVRFQRKEELLRHIDRRTRPRISGGFSPFLRGEREETIELIRGFDPIAIELVVYSVQPGLSASRLAERVRTVMAAANDSLAAQQVQHRWITSE